jgi:hypothetical protein
MSATTGPVVVKAVEVRCSAAHAFEVFTARIADWWPLATHSLGAGLDDRDAVSCAVEPRVGGRIYEVLDDGGEFEWGRVVGWRPGELLALDWNPSLTARPPTRVEVRFTATGADTCQVELTHRGFEAWVDAADDRDSYDAGWAGTLQRFAAVAGAD